MKWSKALIPTLKEEPKEAESASHKLLLRGGFIKQHQSGVYIFLPLGWRIQLKIAAIIRDEMNKIGAQEMLLPALTASELWEESGRWTDFGSDMFRLRDRKGRDLALAPTHEEIMTDIARYHIRSYRDLPQIWYQIQEKFRDEPRPRSGILRVREFLMKDSYSFDSDWEGLDESYEKHRKAYNRIFDRSGLKYKVVEASSGLMGGSQSEEYMVLSDAGEDALAVCEKCGYAANVEVASGIPRDTLPDSPFSKREKVYTPDVKTVEEVSSFLNVTPQLIVKSLLYFVGNEPILVLIRGDHEVNEAKLKSALGFEARLATPEEVLSKYGVSVGFIGPLGIEVKEILADNSLKGIKGCVVGANQDEYHIVGVDLEDEVNISRFEDLRLVKDGDGCPKCEAPLSLLKAIEIGHIFKLGTKYSESMKALYTDREGNLKPIVMGSYGIGLGRIMASAIELYHDKDGISWPITIAPYEVEILEINPKLTRNHSEAIYNQLVEKNIDCLFDDRDVTPGVKFKDADLIGIPLKVIIGEKTVKSNLVEIEFRRTKEKVEVRLEDASTKTKELVEKLKGEYDVKQD
jgi:prolyl-tRNA synthetase